MLVFWRHGYETTSVAALTAAMGITPPSLYTAFGDKKRLFLEAVAFYLSAGDPPDRLIEQAPDARSAATALLRSAAVGCTGAETPPGCLLATSAITGSREADDVREALAGHRARIEAALRARIEGDIRAGALPVSADPDTLAGMVMATVQGLSTLARDGASRDKLLRIADASMAAWPRADASGTTWDQ